MTEVQLAFPRRIAPEVGWKLPPSQMGGRRESTGRRNTYAVWCAISMNRKPCNTSRQGSGEHCFPAERLHRSASAPSLLNGFRHHRRAGLFGSRDLTSATAPGPYFCCTLIRAFRQGKPASTSTRPSFRDDADALLSRTGWPNMCPDFRASGKAKYFLFRGLTRLP